MATSNLGAAELANGSANYLLANDAFDFFDRAIAGRLTIDFASDANLTLSVTAESEEWLDTFLTFTDTGVVLTAARDVIFPTENGPVYLVKNSTAQTLTCKLAAQTGVAILAGAEAFIYNNGTDMAEVVAGAGGGVSDIVEDTTPQLGGPLDANAHQIRESKGSNIASATTLTIPADGNFFDVTGTTTVTAFSAVAVGTEITLQFDGALTLTHSATDLILPTGANITTAAGDVAKFREYATGDWACVSYQKANGEALAGGGSAAGRKNAIINGNFDVWQDGTSFTDPASATYTADQWNINMITGGGAGTVTRQSFALGQTDVPDNPTYFLRIDKTTAGTGNVFVFNRIEDVKRFSGESITVSFYAKAAAAHDLSVTIQQNFGSGGTPSSSVNTTIGTASLTTSWQRFTLTSSVPSVSGKALGTDGNDWIGLRLVSDIAVTFTIDLSQVQIEKGIVATDFEHKTYDQELRDCRYFYRKANFYIPSGTAQTIGLIDMRDTPAITGGGAGFSSTGTTKDTLIAFQTTGAVATLDLDARL